MLQGLSVRKTAKVLLGLSIPASIFFVVWSFADRSRNLVLGLAMVIGFQSLIQCYQIYRLMKAKQLCRHPLFAHAASDDGASIGAIGGGYGANGMTFHHANHSDDDIENSR